MKGNGPAFFWISENTMREVFILSWYVTSDERWKMVVRDSSTRAYNLREQLFALLCAQALTLPSSPDDTRMSMP